MNVRYSNAKTTRGLKAHGTYVERESAKGRAETDVRLYGAEHEVQTPHPNRLGLAQEHSLDSLADHWQKAGDEHIFKIIISLEDPTVNFQRTAGDMIARIEQHTGAPVEWAGVVHRNTDHPHAHLIVLPSGEALKLPPMLIRKGLREAVQTSLTQQVGPRTMEDIERQKQIELTANRVTPLDRRIAGRAKSHSNDQGYSDAGIAANPGELARLRHLKELGLATVFSPECCLRTAEAPPIREKTPAEHHVRPCVLSPITEQRFNSRAAPTEISTYRRGFPLAGGTGARCSSIPS